MIEAKRIKGFEELDSNAICYWKASDRWMLYFPRCGVGDLSLHTVTEHEDGTITVTPSILTKGHDNGKQTTVHGYLTKGVWNPC